MARSDNAHCSAGTMTPEHDNWRGLDQRAAAIGWRAKTARRLCRILADFNSIGLNRSQADGSVCAARRP